MPHARWFFRLTLLVGLVGVGNAPAAESTRPVTKVHPLVLERCAAEGTAEFLIFLDEQADLAPVAELRTKDARGHQVVELLTATAARAQPPLIAWLEERAIPHRPFWIANMIWARAGFDDIADLAARADVRRLDANPKIRLDEPRPDRADGDSASTRAIEWGVGKVGADEVWAMGYDGTGIVIGGQDTGYDWDHPALISRYRGWNGSVADHDYNWHDAVHSGGGICGADSPVPCDDHSHGTHTMGTMVGDDGGANRIGVAPGAQWVSCRNMDQGVGTAATYSECFEFLLGPTDLDGNNRDPSKAPHVINNSWLCPPDEGCSHEVLKVIVDHVRSAGIVVVGSAGNDGSSCSSIRNPPAIYDSTFTVGATNSSDTIAGFSSRGPVTVDDSQRLKPDLSAPGVSVRSSVPGGGYSSFSGTSMAGPHVAGVVALLLDARPDLIGKVEEVESILRRSAVPRTSSQECGGIPGSQIPNPVYGHGRIDAFAALTGDVDGDGVDNLTDCAPLNGSVWTRPGPASNLTVEKIRQSAVFHWSAPVGEGAGVVSYDLLRSAEPDDFSAPVCVARNTHGTTGFDQGTVDALHCYLVRAENECGGTLGTMHDGTPRWGGECPAGP